jgi:Zn finger protein HypA/HybF involved in hydrogenase expression
MANVFEIASKHSYENRTELEASTVCGCFHCHSLFAPAEIENWVDAEQTAFCPHCGIDKVIGDKSGYPITKEFFESVAGHWFKETP